MGGKVGGRENGSWLDIGDRWEGGRMEDRVAGGEEGWEVRWKEGGMGGGCRWMRVGGGWVEVTYDVNTLSSVNEPRSRST